MTIENTTSLSGPWEDCPMPSWITRMPENEAIKRIAQFHEIITSKPAPGGKPGYADNRHLYCPIPPMHGLVFPGGVKFLEEEGTKFHEVLEQVLSSLFPDGVFFWGDGYEKQGVYHGPYNAEMRLWIKRDLIFSPSIIMSHDREFVMVCDEQMRFTVVGASEKNAKIIIKAFDGRKNLKIMLQNYINDLGIGFGEEDREWANKYLFDW